MSRLARTAVAAACCVGLAAPAAASATPSPAHSFFRTYPFAAQLCHKQQTGHLPKRLQGDSAQIGQYCQTLDGAFTTAQGNLKSSLTTLKAQATSDVNAARAACVRPVKGTPKATRQADRAACRAALKQVRDDAKAFRADVKAYHVAIEAARKQFWTSVHALPGAQQVQGDQPAPQS